MAGVPNVKAVVSDSYIAYWHEAIDAAFPLDYQIITVRREASLSRALLSARHLSGDSTAFAEASPLSPLSASSSSGVGGVE